MQPGPREGRVVNSTLAWKRSAPRCLTSKKQQEKERDSLATFGTKIERLARGRGKN